MHMGAGRTVDGVARESGVSPLPRSEMEIYAAQRLRSGR